MSGLIVSGVRGGRASLGNSASKIIQIIRSTSARVESPYRPTVDFPSHAKYIRLPYEEATLHITRVLDESTRLLKAMADPVRLRLLNLLAGEREEVCVCHLHDALELPTDSLPAPGVSP